MSKFDRIAQITIAILILFIPILVFLDRFIPVRISCENNNHCTSISSNGSLVFQFSRSVDPDLVEDIFKIDSKEASDFEWIDDHNLRWSAVEPLDPLNEVRLSFSKSRVGSRGASLRRDYSWDIVVREPSVVGLVPTDQWFEIFRVSPSEDGEYLPLIDSDGAVIDFEPSPDGEWILYAVENETGGIDLWKMDRNGSSTELFADCGQDRCLDPSWSFDSSKVAFTRESYPIGLFKSEIYISDIRTEESLLFDLFGGIPVGKPHFSPNGKWLTVRQNRIDSQLLINWTRMRSFPLKDHWEARDAGRPKAVCIISSIWRMRLVFFATGSLVWT